MRLAVAHHDLPTVEIDQRLDEAGGAQHQREAAEIRDAQGPRDDGEIGKAQHRAHALAAQQPAGVRQDAGEAFLIATRSEEHTSELQSLMRISYAFFCLQKSKTTLKTPRQYHRRSSLTSQ